MSNSSDSCRSKKASEQPSVETKDLLAEAVYRPDSKPPLQFAVFRNGAVTVEPELNLDGQVIQPPNAFLRTIEAGVVLLPSQVNEYSSQSELVNEIRAFIHRYVDVPTFWEEMIAHYVLMTWVFDKFSAVPYLRFLGEPGTGKSRLLQIGLHLTHKGISAGGATTSSPLFRIIDYFHGTVILDEADYKTSQAWSDHVKILNSGYMKGCPVLRSEKVGDTFEPHAFTVFGPKVIANRSRFEDHALETRCITLEMQQGEVRKDIPRQLPATFFDEARELRNKLLRWRFDNYARITPNELALLQLDPRLTQIGTPLYSVSESAQFQKELASFLERFGVEQRIQRPEAVVLEAILRLSNASGLRVGEVAKKAQGIAQNFGFEPDEFSPRRVGELIRSFGFHTHKQRDGYHFSATAERLKELSEYYGIRPNGTPEPKTVNVVNV